MLTIDRAGLAKLRRATGEFDKNLQFLHEQCSLNESLSMSNVGLF